MQRRYCWVAVGRGIPIVVRRSCRTTPAGWTVVRVAGTSCVGLVKRLDVVHRDYWRTAGWGRREGAKRCGVVDIIHDVDAWLNSAVLRAAYTDALKVHLEVKVVKRIADGRRHKGVDRLVVEGVGMGGQVGGNSYGGRGALPLRFFSPKEAVCFVGVDRQELQLIGKCSQIGIDIRLE